ncbi:p53-like transcription factor [Saitoella complicata NRRL Y-17804]|nr:p53-like transcription factor [Saitoella complicata NRRL Y-17804]ODQ54038.1 p53-like transcription factor [Saitoella complicata NRRL Y-17804]
MSTINIFEPQTILTAISTTLNKDPIIITLTPTLEGNFFIAAPMNDVTCYRRNYFAPCLLVTANAPPETWIIRGSAGQMTRVQSLSVHLSARMSSSPTKPVPLVQQTSRKDMTGGNPPDPLPVVWNERGMVESKPLTWKRMQFKSATAKNTRTKSSTSTTDSPSGTTTYRGENYSLVLTLVATTPEQVHVPLIEVNSVPICVRGRSAWFYADSATQPIPGVKSQAERWAGVVPSMSSSSNAASASTATGTATGTGRGGEEGVPVPVSVSVPQAGWYSNNTPVAGQQSVNFGLGAWTGAGAGVGVGTGMLSGNGRPRPQPSSLNFSSSLPDYTGGAYSPMNTSTTNAWTPAVFDFGSGSGSAYPGASVPTMTATPTPTINAVSTGAGFMSPPTTTSILIPTPTPILLRHASSDFSSSSSRTGTLSLSRMSTQEERDMDMGMDMDIPAPDLSPREKPKCRSLSLSHHMTPPTVPSMLQRHSISTVPEDQASMSVSQQTGTTGGGGGGDESGIGSGGEGGGEGDGDAYIFYPMDARYALPPVDVVYLPHAGHCHRDTSTGGDGGVGYMYGHGRGFGQGG